MIPSLSEPLRVESSKIRVTEESYNALFQTSKRCLKVSSPNSNPAITVDSRNSRGLQDTLPQMRVITLESKAFWSRDNHLPRKDGDLSSSKGSSDHIAGAEMPPDLTLTRAT